LSVAEIADVLGISPGTVKSRLYHCRHQLRRHMEESTP
jgi:DNA-directed RNA polymerase specialized sigma24 family protein